MHNSILAMDISEVIRRAITLMCMALMVFNTIPATQAVDVSVDSTIIAPDVRVEPKGDMRPEAQDPMEAAIFKDFPITGKIEMKVDGETMVNSRPWQAYDGEFLIVYAFVNYAEIVKLVNDTDFKPFKTTVDGEELGFVQFSVITYTSSNSGGYNELVLSTPVTGYGTESDYQEPEMVINDCNTTSVECLHYKYFAYQGIKWYVVHMWLNEQLPVATGNQLSGIAKTYTPNLDIQFTNVNATTNHWKIEVADEESDTFVSGTIIDRIPQEDSTGQFNMAAMVQKGMDDAGKPGYPKDQTEILATFMKKKIEPYHQSYLVNPKGAYKEAFGDTVNPISMNNIATGSPVRFQGEYLTSDCPVDLKFGGYLAALGIEKYPVDCFVIHNVQAVICPPTNIGPYTEMCNVTFPWKEFESTSPLKETEKTAGK